ncbi:MAG: hypothetical protein WAS72_06405 [Saprospiraceae bacterium]
MSKQYLPDSNIPIDPWNTLPLLIKICPNLQFSNNLKLLTTSDDIT